MPHLEVVTTRGYISTTSCLGQHSLFQSAVCIFCSVSGDFLCMFLLSFSFDFQSFSCIFMYLPLFSFIFPKCSFLSLSFPLMCFLFPFISFHLHSIFLPVSLILIHFWISFPCFHNSFTFLSCSFLSLIFLNFPTCSFRFQHFTLFFIYFR